MQKVECGKSQPVALTSIFYTAQERYRRAKFQILSVLHPLLLLLLTTIHAWYELFLRFP